MAEKRGYNTKARSFITELFENNKTRTFSAGEIIGEMRKGGIVISDSTVYRMLTRLEKDGSLLKYASEGGECAVYQYIGNNDKCKGHLHLKCTSCGAVHHLDCEFMDELSEHLYSGHGFLLSCEGSVIYGVCRKCSNKK